MDALARLKAKAAVRAIPSAAQAREDQVQDRLRRKIELSKDERYKHAQYAEVHRVLEMPLYGPMDDLEREAYCRENILAPAFDAGWRLWPTQANALMEYETQGGGFFPIGVGWGKTLISLMVAGKAWAKGHRKMLLLLPPQVLGQLVERDIRWARTRVRIDYPIHVIGGLPRGARAALTASNKAGLYVLPYSYLSVSDTHEMLERIRPRLIICDEAHQLAGRSSARTQRVMRYVEEHAPEGVCLSGTITSKTVMDYYHLIRWCLGKNNPLPNASGLAREWAAVIDAEATSGGIYEVGASAAALRPLLGWARRWFPGEQLDETIPGYRRAFRLRMASAPGVFTSGDAEIGVSLVLANEPVAGYEQSPGWAELEGFIAQIEDAWLTPNGDEIEHAIHTWKWMHELSSGFYNELTWPSPEKLAQRRLVPEPEAERLLERAKLHHGAGQEYSRTLRQWLEAESAPGLDTPLLVAQEMARNGPDRVGYDLYAAWSRWHELDFEGRPERDARAVRVCPFKVDHAVRWVQALLKKKGGGCLLWVYHQEMGAWLRDALAEAGLGDRVLHCPAGSAANTQILDPASADKVVIASITAHGTGKNLQHFRHQLFVQWPRQATTAEQALGRTHRNGQAADELTVATCHTLLFDQLNFAACLNDALYIHQTTGNRQKLIYAAYDPIPKIFPSAVLLERGAATRRLSGDQERMLADKFTA